MTKKQHVFKSIESCESVFRFARLFTLIVGFFCAAMAGCGNGVEGVPLELSISASATQGVAQLEVTFNATVSGRSDNEAISFSWDFGDGSVSSTEQNPTHIYTEAGQYTTTLTATDGTDSSVSENIVISVVEPLAIQVTAAPHKGIAPLEVDLSATVTGGKEPRVYEWDFGNGEGTSSEQQDTSYRFETAGVFDATLTVTDAWGNSQQAKLTITAWDVPDEFVELFTELSNGLDAFEAELDAQWDGTKSDVQFAAQFAAANGNKGWGLLQPGAFERVVEMLDTYQQMGVTVVKLEAMYPLLTQGYHDYLKLQYPNYTYDAQDYVTFYEKVKTEIDKRGFEILIGHANMFPSVTGYFSPQGYYDQMKVETGDLVSVQARFLQERWEEMVEYLTIFEPKYFTIIEEPNTNNWNFGLVYGQKLYDETGWINFVETILQLAGVNGFSSQTSFGAGTGAWEPDDFIKLYATIEELDYIDFHAYGLANTTENFYQNIIDRVDYVRSVDPTKKFTIGETWLAKLSAVEASTDVLEPVEYTSRDVWRCWQPLDQQFLEIFYKICHFKGIEVISPFWTQHFFSYLDYEPGLAAWGKDNPVQLIGESLKASLPNIRDYVLTGTGERYSEIMSRDD